MRLRKKSFVDKSLRKKRIALVKAKEMYRSPDVDKLNFDVGDTIFVTNNDNENWWEGELMKKGVTMFGLFPSEKVEFVKVVKEEEEEKEETDDSSLTSSFSTSSSALELLNPSLSPAPIPLTSSSATNLIPIKPSEEVQDEAPSLILKQVCLF